MNDRERDLERRDDWAIADVESAIGILSATVGGLLGPEGAIFAAFVGPYAKLAIARFRELRRSVESLGIENEKLVQRLDENEALAQLVAEVVRGTVESDLKAKRRVLARAAIHALQDDAVVDDEAKLVRAADAIDTVDVRVLAVMGGRGASSANQIAYRMPGLRSVLAPSLSSLESAGLVTRVYEAPDEPGDEIDVYWDPSVLGRLLLSRLMEEGLETELKERKVRTED